MPAKVTYYSVAGLNKAIRRLPKQAKAKLRDANQAIANKVAGDARVRAARVGGIARHVGPSIRSGRDTVPVIRMGNSLPLPTAGDGWERRRTGPRQTIGDVIWGAEFGSTRHTQFSPWKGNAGDAGYFLWPAVRDDREYIAREFEQAVANAEASTFKGESRR